MRRRFALVAEILIIIFILGALRRGAGEGSAPHDTPTIEPELKAEIGDTFAFEAAARFNEGIVANVDAIDTSLTTILAGDVALLVLIVDKLKELSAVGAAWAAGLMALSTLACFIAYVIGFSVYASARDGARPWTLIPDLVNRPKEGLTDAVVDLVRAGEQNLVLRSRKKGFALLAIVFLLIGAVAIALARVNGSMV